MPKDTKADPTIRLNPCRFAFVARFASREETRFYLNGVHIEPHPETGIVMVATDGHRLAVAHDPDGKCAEPSIVETKPMPALFRVQRRYRETRTVELTPQDDLGPLKYFAVRRDDEGEIEEVGMAKWIDGQFPDWRRVVPWKLAASETCSTLGIFNARYIEDFCARYVEQHFSLGWRQDSATDPTVVTRADIPWFLGVIMPMRHEYNRPVNPALLAMAPKEPEPA